MDFNIWVDANRGAVWLIIGVLAALAAFFVFAGVQEGGVVLFLLATVCAAMAYRVACYFLQAHLSITPTHLVIGPFWKPAVKWRFEDTKRWETETQLIETNARGRRLPVPITVQHLHRTNEADATDSIVLPAFAGNNADVLAALTQRSGVAIEVRG